MTFRYPRLERSQWLENADTQSTWFKFEKCEVYLRQGRRILDGNSIFVVQIANINSPVQQAGQFYRLVDFITARTVMDWVMVENVLNEHLAASLRRRGWIERVGGFDQPSFYLQISGSK